MLGQIFDIRRFSTHDGNGIRTTVFLKGCPLRCVWCQNPEGMDLNRRPIWFEKQCIHCNTCVHLAKNNGVTEEDGKIVVHPQIKEDWDTLYDACPAGALKADSYAMEAEALAKKLEEDIIFFRHGGGVTFSGGEPLLQADFLLEVLKELKKKGIHTAIETALNVPDETVEKVTPYLDQIYADMKLEDLLLHQHYTGVGNGQIKENLSWLLTSEYRERVIVRTPLIPGMTATEENLSSIAKFLTEHYAEVHYELLNYNPLAEAKYHLVDREYCFKENPKLYSKEEMLAFGAIARKNGIRNLILEV